ncbi:MAG: 4-hydroxybenzoyl-CoA reductase subunit beta [Myxococcales bacterium]|nr:4-hydroxybenzoyl-CoA reductase subunit beta [Myxococcales bacterium]
MLPFPRFSFEAPDTVDEAVRLAASPGAMLLSGGTDLLPSVKHRLFQPELLVSTRRLSELRVCSVRADGTLTLGAGLRLRELARNAEVRARIPALAAAAATVATPTIQRMGTLGGNVMLDTRCMYYNQPAGWRAALGGCLKCEGTVCHVAPKGVGCYAAHSADTVPVLHLVGATARFFTATGELSIPIAALYGDDGRTWLRSPPGALLVSVEIPPAKAPIAYRKLRQRGAIDYGLVLTAVTRDAAGFRAVLSAVGPRPVEVSGATAEALVDAAMAAVQPLATHQQAVPWRRKMVKVELMRAIGELV